MKNNITYIFGAGASAHSVPVVFDIFKRMSFFFDLLTSDKGIFNRHLNKSHFDNIKLNLLYKNQIYSSDTYAKSIYLKQKAIGELSKLSFEYEEFKIFLSLFLLFEQSAEYWDSKVIKGELIKYFLRKHNVRGLNNEHLLEKNEMERKIFFDLDPRYILFLSTLTEHSSDDLKFPTNVDLISWNYDQQMETAYTSIIKEKSFEEAKKFFCDKLIKLNGTAVLSKDDEEYFGMNYIYQTKMKPENIPDRILSFYDNHKFESNIQFAWEEKGGAKKNRELAQSKIATSDVIVIIGYSFPDFNRVVDRFIFEKLKSGTKIYVQDPNAENIISKMIGLNKKLKNTNKIYPYKEISSFLIPNEFWEEKIKGVILPKLKETE